MVPFTQRLAYVFNKVEDKEKRGGQSAASDIRPRPAPLLFAWLSDRS
jgi:hypothetical protein